MPANPFCSIYRSTVVFTTIILVCQASMAQKMYYSPSEKNLPAETKTYVIGKVASNIVIWKYMQEDQKSQLLVYDESMNVKLRATADIFLSKNIYQFNFIAQQNSFYVVAQLYKNKNFYCQVAKFNAGGELIGHVKTLVSYNTSKTYYTGAYECIISANKKYVTLIKDKLYASNNEMQLEVALYRIQDTLQRVVEKTIGIPYYKDLHTRFSTLHLDNRGNLYFAEYISQDKDTASHLIVYRSAPDNTNISSCVTDLAGKQLTDINIKLDNLKQQCIVYALWAPGNAYSAGRPAGIFSWVVNENLESYRKDTSYSLFETDGNSLRNEAVSTKDIIALNDNTYTVALASSSKRQPDMYADDNYVPEYNYVNRASFSTSLYDAANAQAYQQPAVKKRAANTVENHSTDYVYTYNNNYNSTPRPATKPVAAPKTVNASLLLLRIDNKANNIMWAQNIRSDHDTSAFAFVNRYSLINSGHDLNFICKKILPGDKQSLENITLDAEGNITVKPIMFRNNEYDVLIDRGVQVDDHSMIFPCVYRDKTLAFARFELE